jgi:hypothetical protein
MGVWELEDKVAKGFLDFIFWVFEFGILIFEYLQINIDLKNHKRLWSILNKY